jgi:putative spermidine/putrescine transport system permease protein
LGLIDSYTGLIMAHTVLSAPLVLITVSASLAGFDPRLEQASRNLGASNWVTMRRVMVVVISIPLLWVALPMGFPGW